MHANFVGLTVAWMARTPPRWQGKIVLVQDHPVEFSHASNWRDNKWAAKIGYRFADGIVSPSPAVRENVIQWCRLAPSSVALIPNPIPRFSGTLAAPPHPWLRDGERPAFVHTSNMTYWKRLDLLIDAYARVREHHEVRLLIVGEGPGRALPLNRSSDLGSPLMPKPSDGWMTHCNSPRMPGRSYSLRTRRVSRKS